MRRRVCLPVSRLPTMVVGFTVLAAACGGWTIRAEAATAKGGVPIAMHVDWSVEHAPKGSTRGGVIDKRSMTVDVVVLSGSNLQLFFPLKSGAHEYELNCTPKALDPPLVAATYGKKLSGRIWIECVFKRADGVPLPYHPKLATWDNADIGVAVNENDGAGGKLNYRVMINPSTSQARIEQARAAQKNIETPKPDARVPQVNGVKNAP